MAYIILPGTHPGPNDVQYDISDVNAGSGNYDSFLRLQAHGTEDGFNTDDGHEADNKDGVFTHSIKFTDMQTVIIDGVEYYELRLDLNEGNAEGDEDIDLSELRLFYSAGKATGADYDNDFDDLNEVFNLTGTIDLDDVHTGSGSDDYIFLIPTSLFADKTGYFTLYSEFTGADGGFEEWRVLANELGTDGLPAIHLEKTAAPEHFNEGTPTNVTFTYTVTSQSSVTDPLKLTSFFDDNATPGDTSDDINLLEGVDLAHPLGTHYVSGDANNNQLLDSTETWIFTATVNGLNFNAGTTRTNVAEVFADDDEGNSVDDSDDAIVTADDVLPGIRLVKEANPTTILEGTETDVTYSYRLTSQSAVTDPLTILTLVDDNGTPLNLLDDINLLEGVDLAHPLGTHYVSGDANNNQLLDSTETWLFNYTVEDVVLNADETRTNIAAVTAQDDEQNPVGDDDDAVVTGEDVDPTMNIDKVASLTQIQAGQSTPVTFTYTVTNTSPASTDPITITHLVDDMGTVSTLDDVVLFDGDSTLGKGIYYVSGDDGDGLLEKGESWVYNFTTNVTLDAGETRTNIVTVDGHDDEDNDVGDTDDASITAYNLGRTPGFWANEKNGGKLWDGSDSTFPKGGDLGTTSFLGANKDLLYTIHDLNADGDATDAGEAVGSRQYIMIGDWDHDGIADTNENVLLITRTDAMSLLNSSEKQQQDGRYMLARDLVASWLNFLGGSYVGNPNDATATNVVDYIDAAVAWLQQTSDGNHFFAKTDFTGTPKVGTSTAKWNTGIDLDDTGNAVNPGTPATGQHNFVLPGANNDIDILGGGILHTGLDHYNNYGFI